MANLIIQENGAARTAPAVHGEEITIQTPCDCSAVTGVQIAGVAYPFYDAAGNNLSSASGLFGEGSLIRVLIDTTNNRAYLLNQAVSINDGVPDHEHNVSDLTGGTLPVARGGTGITKNPSMLTDLGSNTADTVFEASPRPGVTGTLPVKNGGTGVTTATANQVFAAPNGSNGAPSFRALAAADIPNHSTSKLTSGTLGVARGGTGITSNPSMLVNLGSTANASVFTANPSPGVTGTLGVANGGTGVNSLDALATALGAARIQTGSFTGKSNDVNSPISLTFGFAPKVVFLVCFTLNYHMFEVVNALTTSYQQYGFGNYNVYAKKSSDGKTISLYGLGASGTFQWVAIA